MKPLRARIQAACASTGAPQTVVEKDYAISYVLLAIARTMTLRTAFVLKGGTTLKKLYFGDYCFSEDLDVSAVDAPTGPGLEAALREVATDTAGLLAAHGPFDVSLERYTEHSPHPAGQEAFIVRVRFPWHPSPLCRVKLEVTHDEPVLLPPEERPILPELIAAKCRHRGVSYGSLDSFFSDDLVAEAQRHWQASLGSFVTPLPSCDLVLDELRPLLDGLV